MFDPYKIYDPPGPKPKSIGKLKHHCESYNKENMKLVEEGKTHFPEGKYSVPTAALADTAGEGDVVAATAASACVSRWGWRSSQSPITRGRTNQLGGATTNQ